MVFIRLFLLLSLLHTIPCFAQPQEAPQSADISVNNIFLMDKPSQEKILGKNIKFIEQIDSHPTAIFTSSSGSEFLSIVAHEGGSGEVAEFDVSYSTKNKTTAPRLKNIRNFLSGKNIQLGMSKTQLFSTFGKPQHHSSKGKFEAYEYRIEDLESKNKFLTYYNMPIYFGNYTFKNNKLIKFRFGFEYP